MKNTYTLGLVSISFRALSPREIIEAAARAGLSCIEWGSDVHAPCTDHARLAEIVELQKRYGITTSSYGTYFRLGVTPFEELADYVAAAKLLGTDILRLWCGNKSGAAYTEEERATLLSLAKEAARLAERQSVTLCMECHQKTFTERREDAVWLMQQVGSAHFRMYWQPFQWQTVSENEENARVLAPFAVHVHVFNWREKEKLPLAQALLTWRAYLKQLPPPRALLLEFMPNGTIAELDDEVAALKKIVEETV